MIASTNQEPSHLHREERDDQGMLIIEGGVFLDIPVDSLKNQTVCTLINSLPLKYRNNDIFIKFVKATTGSLVLYDDYYSLNSCILFQTIIILFGFCSYRSTGRFPSVWISTQRNFLYQCERSKKLLPHRQTGAIIRVLHLRHCWFFVRTSGDCRNCGLSSK